MVISVCCGEVVVKVPVQMTDATVERFLESKRTWVIKKLAQQAEVSFESVRAGKTLLDGGEEKQVVFGAPRDTEEDNVFYLKDERRVRRYFEKTRGWMLTEMLNMWAKKVGVDAADVRICDFKARWGSCDAARCIKLNWRLTMLPPRLRDYVLIHELCHLTEMNHSAAFWKLVQKHCADFADCRKDLKKYSFLTLLYR